MALVGGRFRRRWGHACFPGSRDRCPWVPLGAPGCPWGTEGRLRWIAFSPQRERLRTILPSRCLPIERTIADRCGDSQ